VVNLTGHLCELDFKHPIKIIKLKVLNFFLKFIFILYTDLPILLPQVKAKLSVLLRTIIEVNLVWGKMWSVVFIEQMTSKFHSMLT